MNQPMEQLRRSKRLKQRLDQNTLTFSTDKGHPLLNGLILETVFSYLKGQSNATTLSNYRVVCKIWDQEIVKLLRRDTQINLIDIVTPYPEGMGWTTSPDNLYSPFTYEAPYPEIRSFENIFVNANFCENLQIVQWVKWFEMMGLNVKRLTFSAPFTCFCQNHFLERILKEWCPNLESLELQDVKCADSLLLMSSFLKNSTNFICNGLKHLKISFDKEEPYSLCTEKDITRNNLHVLDINIRKLCMKLSIWKVVDFIYDRSINSRNNLLFPEIVNTSGKKVTLPVYLRHNQSLPDLSPYFLETLKPTDGGIVGQIMKNINVEKLSINGMDDVNRYQDLASFFHIRPNKWRLSLKSLELDEFVSRSLRELHVIGQVRFQLTRIKFGGVHLNRDNEEMTRFLANFSETLEHLEISGPLVQQEIVGGQQSELILPRLPKLKTFKHENINKCWVSARNLWGSAPNLERCCLYKSLALKWKANKFFENTGGISSNVMRELTLAAPISGKQAEQLLKWFPKLVKMDIVLEKIGGCAHGFFGKVGRSKVEHLKIGFLGYLNKNRYKVEKDKRAVLWKAGSIQGLKSMELNNMSDLPFRTTGKGFLNANLNSLRLVNFRVYTDEEKILRESLSHIPSVELVNTVFISV